MSNMKRNPSSGEDLSPARKGRGAQNIWKAGLQAWAKLPASCILHPAGRGWSTEGKRMRGVRAPGPLVHKSFLHWNSFGKAWERCMAMSFTERGDGRPAGRGCSSAVPLRAQGAGPGQSPRLPPLTHRPVRPAAPSGIRFLAGSPCADLGRSEGGSANLEAAPRVWQTRGFSSALC